MTATLAEHVQISSGRTTVTSRILHLGILVCPGHPMAGVMIRGRPVRAPTLPECEATARWLLRDLNHIYRPFTITDELGSYSYRFAFVVKSSQDPTPVHSNIHYPPNSYEVRTGSLRRRRSAQREAARRDLENIAIIVQNVPGDPHAPYFDATGAKVSVRRRNDGLLERTSNAMWIGENDVAADQDTGAHEAGHMFGLWNTSSPGSIMGPRSADRRLLPRDKRRLHRAVQIGLPGIRRPDWLQTSGNRTPYVFPHTQPAL